MKKVLLIVSAVVLFLVVAAVMFIMVRVRDRNPRYSLDLNLSSGEAEKPAELRVGVAKVTITPALEDTWVDVNGNARYEPARGDSFVDVNGNGKFDAFWLAGFHNSRAARSVHDDLWARAVLWESGDVCVALVVLDAIGLFHDDVISVRERIAVENPSIDHVMVAATHNHEVPDLMGLWGPGITRTGVNPEYLQRVEERAAEAVRLAWEARKPALIRYSRIEGKAQDLVEDSRPPVVLDDAIRLMQFVDRATGKPFGLLLNWGNHPETLASRNLDITSDFCHFWLNGIEKGIYYDGECKRPGTGGTAVFVNGAIGGLMTTLHVSVNDPWLGEQFEKASFEKARAQGHRLADLVLEHLEKGEWKSVENPAMHLLARTFLLKVDNRNFKLGGYLGIFHRGFIKGKYVRTEVNLLTLGPVWMLTVPGEINPEIINGGIEVPSGADYAGDPVEVPPVRRLMKGEANFVFGLTNDEVGYIMPKTHWDSKPPYTYGTERAFYGEVNSLGPDTGPVLYREIQKLISDL